MPSPSPFPTPSSPRPAPFSATSLTATHPNTLATWCKELTHWKRPWCRERLKEGGEEDDGGWDGRMASLTRWTWVWVSSGVGDGQGSLACYSPWGHKEPDTTEVLNWTDRRTDYAFRLLGSKSWLYHLLAVWPWAWYLTSLCLSFLLYKTEIVKRTVSKDYCECCWVNISKTPRTMPATYCSICII